MDEWRWVTSTRKGVWRDGSGRWCCCRNDSLAEVLRAGVRGEMNLGAHRELEGGTDLIGDDQMSGRRGQWCRVTGVCGYRR